MIKPHVHWKTWHVDDKERKLKFHFRFCWYGFNIELELSRTRGHRFLIQFGEPSLMITNLFSKRGFKYFKDISDV